MTAGTTPAPAPPKRTVRPRSRTHRRHAQATRIHVISYGTAGVQEQDVDELRECVVPAGDTGVTWIDVDGLESKALLDQLGECFHLNPLVIEDILNTNERPKSEDYGDHHFIVVKMLFYDDARDLLIVEQVSLVLGRNYVISIQEQRGDLFDPVRKRIREGTGRIRHMGADYLAYSLLDAIVDGCFGVLELIGEDLDQMEDALVSNPGRTTVQKIHAFRRRMLVLRKSVWPLREVIGNLARGGDLVSDPVTLYFRDVYDHAVQVIDMEETYRDMLSGMLDIYLSSVSNRLNEVMKVLTVISTIFIPLTFIVGLYGMNFQYMPELHQNWGYPAVLVLMLTIAVSLLVAFKRKGWF